ncbi:MAG: response regulator [Myxococcales bacterium]|nr:response regulator [Myxococcales bacterium]
MPTRILFVDDEPDLEPLIRQKYRRQIRRKEMELDFARHGGEALEVISRAESEHDLIITDINMPEMNGLELLGRLSTLDLSSPVIVLSAYGDMANIRAAMNRGAYDFLTKPIDFNDLEITKQKALDHLASLRERSRLQQDKARLEERARFVRATFGRYLSDTVVETLLDEPEGLRLGGEKRELSILMSDLRGFTTLCERLPPEKIVSMINNYFGAMIDIVMDQGGTIDELIGDAMLVIFGAPLRQPDHADRAVECAIAMQRAMESVNRTNAADGLPQLEMGIAVNTGEAVVGNIGSRKRSKYGVVGSHVNLTARIESLTVGQQVLISDDTRRACSLDLDVAEGHVFTAKGFVEPVTVHEVRGVRGDPSRTIPRVEPQLEVLEPPLEVRVRSAASASLEGDEGFDGVLVRASAHFGELETEGAASVQVLEALRLELAVVGEAPVILHGKVVGKPDSRRLLVRFTAVPPALLPRLGASAIVEPLAFGPLDHHTAAIDLGEPGAGALEVGAAETDTPGAGALEVSDRLATLGLMLAGFAHDIRSPLAFVGNFADLSLELADEVGAGLRQGTSGDPKEDLVDLVETVDGLRANLDKIKAHGTRAWELIGTMLDTVRGHRAPAREIEVNELVSRHLDLLESSMRAAEPQLELQLERRLDDAAGSICVSPQDFSRILLNLVHNACDAARTKAPELRDGAPPRVRISTVGAPDHVELRVWDDGVGIPPALQHSVFEPAFTTKGPGEGLGLGLALTRALIESSGGTITVRSEPDRFTEFVVTLPRASAPQEAPSSS